MNMARSLQPREHAPVPEGDPVLTTDSRHHEVAVRRGSTEESVGSGRLERMPVPSASLDTAALRKARGAFCTPEASKVHWLPLVNAVDCRSD